MDNAITTKVDNLSRAAYWYAVGFSDASGKPDSALEFSRYAQDLAGLYYSKEITMLPSIPDMFSDYTQAVTAATGGASHRQVTNK